MLVSAIKGIVPALADAMRLFISGATPHAMSLKNGYPQHSTLLQITSGLVPRSEGAGRVKIGHRLP
jgi:hypothetical protein